jgi:uncharacterized membrane protein YdjX (TVP38/TMEM64 family)
VTTRFFALLIFIVIVVLLAPYAWGVLSGNSLAEIAAYVRGFGFWAPLVSLALMVLQTIIVPLPGSFVTAANGAIFGVWWGTLLSWLGGLLGGSVAFWIARTVGGQFVQRWVGSGEQAWASRLSQSNSFWAVLIARLIPGLSFDIISYLAGLSTMSYPRFLLATAIGMLPGTFAFTLFGSDLAYASENAWRLSLLGLFGVVMALVGRRITKGRKGAEATEAEGVEGHGKSPP